MQPEIGKVGGGDRKETVLAGTDDRRAASGTDARGVWATWEVHRIGSRAGKVDFVACTVHRTCSRNTGQCDWR